MNAWILLRGLTREARHWGPFTAQLAERVAPLPVHAIDLPGNGALHAVRSPADVPSMAEACRARLAALGLAPPFGVVAMSLGAMVTTAWAQRYPGELARAVLIGTSLRPWSPLQARLRPSAWPTLLRAAAARDPLVRERAVWAMTSRRPAADRDAVVAAWAAFQRSCPVTAGNAWRQLWAAARYRAQPARPAVPLLLLCGAGDRLVHPGCSAAIARAWDAPLRVHPWAGHDVPLDDPAWVVDAIAEGWARPVGDGVPLLA